MSDDNKAVLEKANALMANGDIEGFLRFCTDDTQWTFVGDRTLEGKSAVREYLADAYGKPPKFNVTTMIAEDDTLAALGDITITDKSGKATAYTYCDVWTFREGKLDKLRAFVIAKKPTDGNDCRA